MESGIFGSLQKKIEAKLHKVINRGVLREEHVNESLDAIKTSLLEADVNYRVVQAFLRAIKTKLIGEKIELGLTPAQTFLKQVQIELTSILGSQVEGIHTNSLGTTNILLAGLQGSGKTTTAAKLAYHLVNKSFQPFLVSIDIYRPAALEQLKILAEAHNIQGYFDLGLKDPIERVKKAQILAKEAKASHLLVDTAGRLQMDNEMMEELKAVKKVLPFHETLLVIDAMVGQESLSIAREFDQQIGLSGFIFTKTDGNQRGGAMISARSITGKPIKFIGAGEKIEHLSVFHPERASQEILGMGDLMSLIEKLQLEVNLEDPTTSIKRVLNKRFNLEDFSAEMTKFDRMSYIGDYMKLLPNIKRNQKFDMEAGKKRVKMMKAIIQSMTKEERLKPDLLNAPRKKRIAAGAARSVNEVNQTLSYFNDFVSTMKKYIAASNKNRFHLFR